MFIVMVDLWNSTHDDYYDGEYSGVRHATRSEAETELLEAKVFVNIMPRVMPHSMDVRDVYIKEV